MLPPLLAVLPPPLPPLLLLLPSPPLLAASFAPLMTVALLPLSTTLVFAALDPAFSPRLPFLLLLLDLLIGSGFEELSV